MSLPAELVAGGVAGAVGILATQPMDTVRIRLQSSPSRLGISRPYSGLFDCFSSAMRGEGIRGLYKGVASPTLTVGVMNAVLFFSYEYSTNLVRTYSHTERGEQLSIPQVALAGSMAGFASAFITAPTELVKCIAQTNLTNEGRIHEEWQIFRNMVRDHGWLGAHGPCRGLGATVCRETPSFAVYFTTYEAATRRYGKSELVSFVAGGFAGTLGWTIIYPLDVIKTRWQTSLPGTYKSFRHCFQTSVAQEGWKMLFNGYGATMARAWPQNGVIFLTYELIKGILTR